MNGGDFAGFFQYEFWIDACIVPANAEEQMRSGGAAGGSDAAENGALLDFLAGLDLDIGEMEIHADEAVAVIDENGVAFEEHIFGHHDGSVGDCEDGAAHGGRIIDSHVGLRRGLTVEDTLHSEGFSWWQRARRGVLEAG